VRIRIDECDLTWAPGCLFASSVRPGMLLTLPSSVRVESFYTYNDSLTTPGCTEDLR
jgi:hypothetical protein